MNYTYDSNPVNSSFSQYTTGRLAVAQYTLCGGGNSTPVTEMYSYHPAGAVTSKQMDLYRCGNDSNGNYVCGNGFVEADYTYNSAGQVATYSSYTEHGGLPWNTWAGPTVYTYAYDGMGRAASLTDNSGQLNGTGQNTQWVQNGTYDFAGRMTSLQMLGQTKTQTWNVNGQMTSVSQSASGIQYNYSATANNGRITGVVDSISGETISYQYDALKRLTSASSTPSVGSTPSAWTENFQYDGFGNLTAKVLNGTTATIGVNAATNRLASATYDLNGNMISGAGASLVYDEANRLASATPMSGGTEYYGYAPDNKRVYRVKPGSPSYPPATEYVTLYGAYGERLGVYSIWGMADNYNAAPYLAMQSVSTSVWFAGQLISENGTTKMDRLGTNRAGELGFIRMGMRLLRRGMTGLSLRLIQGIRLRVWIMQISECMRRRTAGSISLIRDTPALLEIQVR